jgi:predicted RNA binding protein YcfA (HicA-like mRNA interferase family)
MPSARADEFRRAASKLGFLKARQTGSHEGGDTRTDVPRQSRFTVDNKSVRRCSTES